MAKEIAGLTFAPEMPPIRYTTMARAPPIIKGLPPLAKIARIKKNEPRYSAT